MTDPRPTPTDLLVDCLAEIDETATRLAALLEEARSYVTAGESRTTHAA